MLLGDFRDSSNWMQNLAQKIHFGPCLGILPETRAKHRFRVRSRQTPGNARFARPSIGIERFSGENIRWAKAQGLGRHVTRLQNRGDEPADESIKHRCGLDVCAPGP